MWKAPFVRINGSDIDSSAGPLVSIGSQCSKVEIKVDDATVDPSAIKAVWYRRWSYKREYRQSPLFSSESHRTQSNILAAFSHLGGELGAISGFLFSTMDSATWLGRPSTSLPNKLQALKMAAEMGIAIPDTLVTSNVEDLKQFIRGHGGQVITKPSSDVLICDFEERGFGAYTSIVTESMAEECWRGSFPSMFQEKLEKNYEIRTFYLDGKFYSMAMFTQSRASTKVDFRRYSYSDPVRTVPYQLPLELEDNLRRLMERLRLDSGSIDMVRTVDRRFVFLEVNPVGQFGMVSYPCNYHLEREVARALVNRMNGNRQEA